MTTAPHPYVISVREYDRMVEAGVFPEDVHIELLEGELIEMSPANLPHSGCIRRLNGLLHGAGAQLGTVLVQLAVRTAWHSKPQPDLVLLRPPAEQYDYREWTESDVLLLVEVSHSSLTYDRRRKVPHYARVGIPEVWLVDVAHELIRAYGEPSEGVYKVERIARRGQTIQSEMFPSLRVTVDQILGPTEPIQEAYPSS